MGLTGAYCSHRCSLEVRPSWLTAKPHPLSCRCPRFAAVGLGHGRQAWPQPGRHTPYWLSSGFVLKGRKGEDAGWGTPPRGSQPSRSPLPLHAPPMTRNSCTGWKGDLGFHDAHLLVPWLALQSLATPSPSICEVPKFSAGQLFVFSLFPPNPPLKHLLSVASTKIW